VPNIQGGAVAQLVEQRTENPCVGGSIPPHTTVKQIKARELFLWLFAFFLNAIVFTINVPLPYCVYTLFIEKDHLLYI
jgi:hypothetical protein